jgi:hypothetical protein
MDVLDLLIVGAGPHALCSLLRLLEGKGVYSDHELGTKRKYYKENAPLKEINPLGLRYKVVDPSGQWMHHWDKQFEVFNIPQLRSPTFVHPDPFDEKSLFAYAIKNNRENELYDVFDDILEKQMHSTQAPSSKKKAKLNSRVFNQQTDRWMYKSPSTKLFKDFCDNLIKRYELANSVLQGTVQQVTPVFGANSKVPQFFDVAIACEADGACSHVIRAKKVIMTIGLTQPNVPEWCSRALTEYAAALNEHSNVSQITTRANTRLFHSSTLVNYLSRNKTSVKSFWAQMSNTRTLIVGGGLTSSHLALNCLRAGCSKVHFAARKKLLSKHYDVDLKWVGKYRKVHLNQFWDKDFGERHQMIREARGGGSVSPYVLKELKELAAQSNKLNLCECTCVEHAHWNEAQRTWGVLLTNGQNIEVDYIFVATGRVVNIETEPVFKDLMQICPVETINGLPKLSIDLQWCPGWDLYISGAYAALQVGPDALNIAGARTASERIFAALNGDDYFGDENFFDILANAN